MALNNISDVMSKYDPNNSSANISSTPTFPNLTDYFAFLEQDLAFQKFTVILNTYVIPVIIILGFIGNTIAFSVFVGTHLNRQSSSVYLAFLAAVDNLFLITLLFVWFGFVEIHIFQREGWCQCIIYCTYVCSFLSIWTVLSFTFERYIVVFYPLRRHRLCTRKRAAGVMVAFGVVALAFYSFVMISFGVRYTNDVPSCRQLPEYYNVHKIMTTLDTLIAVLLPTVAIVAMNTAIGIKVYNYTRRNLQMSSDATSLSDYYSSSNMASNNRKLAVELESDASSRHCRGSRSTGAGVRTTTLFQGPLCSRRQLSQMRITRALLVISTVFIVLNLPSHAFRILAFVLSFKKGTIPLAAYTWLELLQFLYYLSFSSNFVLYMIFSRNFRNAFRRLIRRTRYNVKENKVVRYLRKSQIVIR